MELDQAVEDFWNFRHGGPFPEHYAGNLEFDDGFRVCLALRERHAADGNPQVGWKVGLTAKAIQAQAGVHHPSWAVLYERGRWASGHSHPAADLITPGWENELCLTMGATLSGPDATIDDAAAAVASVQPAFEIIERRFKPGPGLFPLGAADNGQQRAFVVGEATRFDPDAHDLAAASVEVFVDGESREVAYGREVMESSPLASIAWLANDLARFGLALEEGMQVMSGSFTKQYHFDGPTEVAAKFDPFGEVRVTFT